MQKRNLIRSLIVAVLLVPAALDSCSASVPRYRVTDIGHWDRISSLSINDLGHVALFWETSTDGDGMVWHDGITTDLNLISALMGNINNRDHIPTTTQLGATIRSIEGSTIATYGGNSGMGIWLNNRDALGWMRLDFLSPGAPWYAEVSCDGETVELGKGDTLRLNDQGQVVMYAQVAPGSEGPFLWEDGTLTRLASMGVGSGSCINNSGVIGGGRMVDGKSIGCVWQNGTTRDLPTLPLPTIQVVTSLNDVGQAVGSAYGGCAVLWHGGQFYDLNAVLVGASGYVVTEAWAINNLGEIVCLATYNNEKHAVVLTPEAGVKTWKGMAMVSAPSIPWEADPKKATGLDTDFWYSYDPSANAYAGYADHASWFEQADSTPVRGFWARFDKETRVPLWIIPQQGKPVSIPLKPGWNLIGQPFLRPVDWNMDALQVKTSDGISRTLRQASDAVRPYAWGWKQDPTNRNTGSYYLVADPSYSTSASHQLQPWEGYWVKAQKPCDLILAAPDPGP